MTGGIAVSPSRRSTSNLGPAIRYEWARLRTSRAARVVLVVTLVFAAIAALSIFNDVVDRGLTSDVVVASLTLAGDLTGIPVVPALVGVLAVLAATDDLTTSLGATTYLVVPIRSRALLAKLVVLGASGVVASGAVTAGVFVAGTSAATDGGSLSWPAAALGHLLATVLWVMWGLGLGLLVRSMAGAIALLFGLPLIGEVIIGLILLSNDVPGETVALVPFRSMITTMSGERPLLSAASATTAALVVLLLGWRRLRAADI